MSDFFSSFFQGHRAEILLLFAVYIGGYIFMRLLKAVFVHRLSQHVSPERRKRIQTIARLLHAVVHAVFTFILVIWIFRLFGIDPTPVLASAGVLGLAIGFGAQTLVRDFFSGMFIIIENQYGVGDWVRINGQEGRVKTLGIRHTLLEEANGNRVYIPNGTISVVVNLKEAPAIEKEK